MSHVSIVKRRLRHKSGVFRFTAYSECMYIIRIVVEMKDNMGRLVWYNIGSDSN